MALYCIVARALTNCMFEPPCYMVLDAVFQTLAMHSHSHKFRARVRYWCVYLLIGYIHIYSVPRARPTSKCIIKLTLNPKARVSRLRRINVMNKWRIYWKCQQNGSCVTYGDYWHYGCLYILDTYAYINDQCVESTIIWVDIVVIACFLAVENQTYLIKQCGISNYVHFVQTLR